MTYDIAKELAVAKAKVLQLQEAHEKELRLTLSGLPAEHGFENLEEFIAALKEADRAGRKAAKTKSAAPVIKPAKAKGKRARITQELKEKVAAAAMDGKTGSEIAEAFGISLPSVQNIKKEFGLVKPRGK